MAWLFLLAVQFQVQLPEVPDPLQDWVPWVLVGEEAYFCPKPYNAETVSFCVWQGSLTCHLDDQAGSFELNLVSFLDQSVSLPGGAGQWPLDVQVNGKICPVVQGSAGPQVQLGRGSFQIIGRFEWLSAPNQLQIPEWLGLAKVFWRGKVLPANHREGTTIWINQPSQNEARSNSLSVQVFRKLTDGVPTELETILFLTVTGEVREWQMENIFPQGFSLTRYSSSLPLRQNETGTIAVQLRPGRHQLIFESQCVAHLSELVWSPHAESWPEQETLSLFENKSLRYISLEGGTEIDPSQTKIPEAWYPLPAYLYPAGQSLLINELSRGPSGLGSDSLSQDRTIWLHHDGKTLSVQDEIDGNLLKTWRLDMPSPFILNRFSLNGYDQLITQNGENLGVEVRKQDVYVLAESRGSWPKRLPAVGWNFEPNHLSINLHLPPGYALFFAGGADRVSRSWIESWSLFGLFVLLLMAFAFTAFFGRPLGLLLAGFLVLCHLQEDHPYYIWLSLVASSALVRYLPKIWVRKIALLWRLLSWVCLILISLVFAYQQILLALFPHLEGSPWAGPRDALSRSYGYKIAREMTRENVIRGPEKKVLMAPSAIVQTGAGLPAWQVQPIQLSFDGPVAKEQTLHLVVIPPWLGRFLVALRLLFLGLIFYGLARIKGWQDGGWRSWLPKSSILLLSLGFSAFAQSEYPSAELLDALKNRVMKPRTCGDHCAEIPRMTLRMRAENYVIRLELHAMDRIGVPLPGRLPYWSPQSIEIDNKPATLRSDPQGFLWILAEPGVHQILIQGQIEDTQSPMLEYLLPPRQLKTDIEGWRSIGQLDSTVVPSQIQFQTDSRGKRASDAGHLQVQPFLRVQRVLHLDLDWSVETTVTRLSAIETPLVVQVPLIPGESILAEGISVQDGFVELHFPANQATYSWRSVLPPSAEIKLLAGEKPGICEEWQVRTGEIWHLEWQGLDPIQLTQEQAWLPTWQPWPTETVSLFISRPKAFEGQSLTLDEMKLAASLGSRLQSYTLNFDARASRGGTVQVRLPANCQDVTLNVKGMQIPFHQSDETMQIGVSPGSQNVQIRWQGNQPIPSFYRLPNVQLDQPFLNLIIKIDVPKSRWVLWTGGGDRSPVSLFFPMLAVIFVGAWCLGRTQLTPLKTGHWWLFGFGVAQLHPISLLLILVWFACFACKKFWQGKVPYWVYNLSQLVLIAAVFFGFILLLFSVHHGLLSNPHMLWIDHAEAYRETSLFWYFESSAGALTRPWFFSVSIWFYRVIMLAWSFWLARQAVSWGKWMFQIFLDGGVWRRRKSQVVEPVS